jgi:hypothetical protein
MKRLLSIVVLLGLAGLGLNVSTHQARAAQDQAGAPQQPCSGLLMMQTAGAANGDASRFRLVSSPLSGCRDRCN